MPMPAKNQLAITLQYCGNPSFCQLGELISLLPEDYLYLTFLFSDILRGVCDNFFLTLVHVFEAAVLRYSRLKSHNKLQFPCVYLLTIYPLQV